jgi:tetratricopeptide (TPR) repeat protein
MFARGVSAFILSAAACAAITLTPACETANRQARAFLAEERLQDAKTLLLQTTAQLGDSPDDKLCRGLTLGNLASVRVRLGELRSAKEAAETAVSQLEETLGVDTIALRYPLELLANIAIQNEDFGKGFKLLSRVEKLPQASHSNSATIQGLRAVLMMREGKDLDAEKEYRSAIRERELASEQETAEAIPELWNLGVLYLSDRRAAEAIPLLERCLRIIDHSPPNAELKVKTFLALGLAHARLGNNPPAGNYFRRAIDLIDGLPPALRSDLGRILYSQYAQFLRGVGQKKEAKEIAKKGEKWYGRDTPHLTVSVDSLLRKSRQH